MKKKGFTLIELLAVIVILAIIALIVTPVVSNIIESSKKSANARSVEGHIKNIEYAIIQNAFNSSTDDIKKYDGVTSDSVFRTTAIIPDKDKVYCEEITLSDGLVTIATGCREAGWAKEFTYEKGVGAYVTGEARPITNPVNPSTPEPDPTPTVDLTVGLFDENDNLLVSWADLVNVYGLDIEKDYTDSTYNTDPASVYSVFTTNSFTGKLVLPDTITRIGNYTAYSCAGLTGVTLSDNVTSIGEYSLSKTGITSIVMPNSVTDLGEGVLYQATALSSITMSENVSSIPNNAFGYTKISTITIPNNATSIGLRAFEWCKSLTSVTIGTGVTKIGNYAFNAVTLNAVTIPSNVKTIGRYAFYNSSISDLIIENGVEVISDHAFSNCYKLTALNVPASVKRIDEDAFSGCDKLATATINAAAIYRWAFTSTGLTTVTLGSNVKYIYPLAFHIDTLTSVTFDDTQNWQIKSDISGNGTSIDVTNPTTNATNMVTTYKNDYWVKSN